MFPKVLGVAAIALGVMALITGLVAKQKSDSGISKILCKVQSGLTLDMWLIVSGVLLMIGGGLFLGGQFMGSDVAKYFGLAILLLQLAYSIYGMVRYSQQSDEEMKICRANNADLHAIFWVVSSISIALCLAAAVYMGAFSKTAKVANVITDTVGEGVKKAGEVAKGLEQTVSGESSQFPN